MEHAEIHDLTAAYALDALDEDEERRYEEHLRGCTACQDELASFWEASSSLAYAAGGPAPPVGLRDRILEAARAERSNVVPLQRRRSRAVPVVGAIAAVAASVAVGLGIRAAQLSESVDRNEALIAILGDRGATNVAIPEADGRLVVSRTREAALVVGGLERAPAGKAYEAWVIEPGADPEPAGLFSGGPEDSVVRLERRVPPGATVAVTLEDEEGVERPTGRPLFAARV